MSIYTTRLCTCTYDRCVGEVATILGVEWTVSYCVYIPEICQLDPNSLPLSLRLPAEVMIEMGRESALNKKADKTSLNASKTCTHSPLYCTYH